MVDNESERNSGWVDGVMVFCKDTNKTYILKSGSFVSLGGSGGGVWGQITGTLSSQTDISDALSGKQASGNYLTAITADTPLSGSGTSGSHLVVDLSGKQTASSALSSVAGLTYASPSFVKMTATGTFGLDTTVLGTSATHATTDYLSSGGTAVDSSKLGGSLPAAYALVGQAMFVGTTSHAINRTSASESLTGITSIDGSAATLTTARNIGGRSFNGSADIVSPTWKTGITTRDITAVSGTVNVAHGLGRVPSFIRVKANLYQALTPPVTTECEGTYDGTNHAGLCTMQSEGTSAISVDAVYSSTAFELGFGSAYNINPYTGATRQTATITCDATNIIFTWTKTGTVGAAVANIKWEAT